MTYAVTALTATGEVDVHSTSIAAIRDALAEARAQSATNISLSKDGKTISESQLDATTGAASTVSVGTALANSAAAKGTVETWA
jgi:hypothetical protein